MFLNFVDYQNGGRSLITLAMYNLGRAFNTTASFTREGMENGLILGNEDLAALEEELLNANETKAQERQITEYSGLTIRLKNSWIKTYTQSFLNALPASTGSS